MAFDGTYQTIPMLLIDFKYSEEKSSISRKIPAPSENIRLIEDDLVEYNDT